MLKRKRGDSLNVDVARWLQKLETKEWTMNNVLHAYFSHLASMYFVINDAGADVARYACMLSTMTNNTIKGDERCIRHCRTQLQLVLQQLESICESSEIPKCEKGRIKQEILFGQNEQDALEDNAKYFRFKNVYLLIINNWHYIDSDIKYRLLADLVAMDTFINNEDLEVILKDLILEASAKW